MSFLLIQMVFYLNHQYTILDEFDDDLSALPYKFNKESLFEEYYCFFLWLRRKNFKIKFLEAKASDFDKDLETTVVLDDRNGVLLYHTWYARLYGKNEYHTNRINKVIEKGQIQNDYKFSNIVWFKDYSFLFNKLKRKIINRIFNRLK